MLLKRSFVPVVLGSLVCSLLIVGGAAQAAMITVPGTSNPYLAGMPTATAADITDLAPAQSPVLVGIGLPAGGWLEFNNAQGLVANSPLLSGSSPYDWTAGPDGSLNYLPLHAIGAEYGKSNIMAPIDSLVGVFLDAQSGGSPAPSTLFFNTQVSRDYASLFPDLYQVFFIGDGLTSGLAQQRVYVPSGATRLYLGVMDGYNWNNNLGAFTVDVNAIPEPATLGFLAAGGLVLLGRRRRRADPRRHEAKRAPIASLNAGIQTL